MNLDEFQSEVVTSNNNLLVIAGPGSGKTTTILKKVEYLCNKGYENDILLLSFTNKSVNDIKERLKCNVFVTTFHSLAIDILKYNNIPYQICSENLLDYIIDEYIKCLDKNTKNKLCIYLELEYLKYSSYEYLSFKKLIKTFISLYKANDKNVNVLKKVINYDKFLAKIILDIFNIYENEKRSTISLDFDDLIKEATLLLKNNYNYKHFKYIIIDEFQDTSWVRLNLVKVIYENSHSIITAVGDDSQSIFHFSGCDLNIFLNFNKYFDAKLVYLKNTYRNSQNLIDISEKFIEKNSIQLKKGMISKVNNNNPIEIITYINSKLVLNKLLDKLDPSETLIISRNLCDINEYINKDLIINENIIYKDKVFKYMTIHSSKGLEAKYVVILNCSNKLLGIPNKLENHPIIDMLDENTDSYPYAEERRVFFVAITRCKEKTFLLVPFSNPSPFIKEIKKML